MILFNTNALHWDENEKTGFRKISVLYKSNNVLNIIANKTNNQWMTQVVPMGYSYTKDEVEFLAELYKIIVPIMDFLEQDIVIVHSDVLDFLESINV